jgi:hypothetical protein
MAGLTPSGAGTSSVTLVTGSVPSFTTAVSITASHGVSLATVALAAIAWQRVRSVGGPFGSGCHDGMSNACSLVTLTWHFPSAFAFAITKPPRDLTLSLQNRMRPPSGDQTGAQPFLSGGFKRITFDPLASTT